MASGDSSTPCIFSASSGATNGFAPGGPLQFIVTPLPAPLTVAASNQILVFGNPLPTFTYTLSGFVNGDTSIPGTPSISSSAISTSLPGTYAINITQGALSSPNYSFAFVPGTLTVKVTGISLVKGDACNGAYDGNFSGNITVSPDQYCVLDGTAGPSGTLTVQGNITSHGGILILNDVHVKGHVWISGTAVGLGQGLQHGICGSTVEDDLRFHDDTNAITIGGSADSRACMPNIITGNVRFHDNSSGAAIIATHNTIGGNVQAQSNAGSLTLTNNSGKSDMQVTDNTAAVVINYNEIAGNLHVRNNTLSSQISGNTVADSLQCNGNLNIGSIGTNTAKAKRGQCAVF